MEYKIFNFTEPGSFVGRDVNDFKTQVETMSKGLGTAIQSNQSVIDKSMGRGVKKYSPDVEKYAASHGISVEQAQQIKDQRTSPNTAGRQ